MREAGRYDVIVVGAGLSGLIAALYVARSGARVLVLERSSRVGGLAITTNRDGYCFNLGAHALYRKGATAKVLEELSIPFTGAGPSLSGMFAYCNGLLHTFPSGGTSLLVSGMLDIDGKREWGNFFAALPEIEPSSLESTSLDDWLSRTVVQACVRDTIRALTRLISFVAESAVLSAGAAVRQLQLSRTGAVYLDGGWQTIVDGLAARAEEVGVDIRRSVPVQRVRSAHDLVIVDVDGAALEASTAILAVPPLVAVDLLAGSNAGPRLAKQLTGRPAARVACFDVGLRRVPKSAHTFVLGIDRPLYLSVHSSVARLAPPGRSLIHVAKFLGDSPSDPLADRREMEALLDVVQPGWRPEMEASQFLPDMTAMTIVPTAAEGGLSGRPASALTELPRVFIAGDWVGHEGQLADASAASAKRAAALAVGAVCQTT